MGGGWSCIWIKKSVIILDNLKVHKSKMTINYLKKTDAMYGFISAYTPEIVPIELIFAFWKEEFLNKQRIEGLNSTLLMEIERSESVFLL